MILSQKYTCYILEYAIIYILDNAVVAPKRLVIVVLLDKFPLQAICLGVFNSLYFLHCIVT